MGNACIRNHVFTSLLTPHRLNQVGPRAAPGWPQRDQHAHSESL
jgi:hypothetical protein